jgi:hypothetical protein
MFQKNTKKQVTIDKENTINIFLLKYNNQIKLIDHILK